jgi:malonyl-CoA O-methyltransferase
MTLIANALSRNRSVARRFGARAGDYDSHAGLQRRVAARLARLLPETSGPSVLEVGCGTGFLTGHLLAAYPGGRFLITDLAPEMVERCEARYGAARGARFAVLDGEMPVGRARFDLIASSMTLQWFADPLTGLSRLKTLLKPGGAVCYATLGPENFPEWRDALAAEGLPAGSRMVPELPGTAREQRDTVVYPSGRAFLAAMKAIGAGEPAPDYRPLPPGAMRRALRRLERDHGASVTWHLVYGVWSRVPRRRVDSAKELPVNDSSTRNKGEHQKRPEGEPVWRSPNARPIDDDSRI